MDYILMFVLILLAGHLIYYTCVSKSENFADSAECPSPLTSEECQTIDDACKTKFNRTAWKNLSASKKKKK